MEDLLAKPCTWFPIDTKVHAVATATKAAATGWTHYIAGVSISASGQPSSSVTVQVLDGASVIDQWEIPPAAFGPIIPPFLRPYRGTLGNSVSVTVGDMGVGIRGTVCIRGFSDFQP